MLRKDDSYADKAPRVSRLLKRLSATTPPTTAAVVAPMRFHFSASLGRRMTWESVRAVMGRRE